jgi:hypothetical protein
MVVMLVQKKEKGIEIRKREIYVGAPTSIVLSVSVCLYFVVAEADRQIR